jgi:hypothetical protein
VWGAEPAGTLHLTLNPVIDEDPAAPAAAVARSILLMIDPEPPPALIHTAHITQHLRGGADGWRITHRSVEEWPASQATEKTRGETVTNQDESAQALSFERDIRPLFRDKDRTSMLKAFDLWSFADVVAHQGAILDQVRAGHMPCDGAWPAHDVSLLADWVAQGSQP